MSIPFSNTHHRIPRGFGNILEGLTREILRDQPKDIPAYAAMYFSGLLKQREESDFDPAQWGATLEDRFYNNKAFEGGTPLTSKTASKDMPPLDMKKARTNLTAKRRQSEDRRLSVLDEFSRLSVEPSTVEIRDTCPVESEVNQDVAAIVIQSYTRGFLARQKVKQMKLDQDTTGLDESLSLEKIDEVELTEDADILHEEEITTTEPVIYGEETAELQDGDAFDEEEHEEEHPEMSEKETSEEAEPVESIEPVVEGQEREGHRPSHIPTPEKVKDHIHKPEAEVQAEHIEEEKVEVEHLEKLSDSKHDLQEGTETEEEDVEHKPIASDLKTEEDTHHARKASHIKTEEDAQHTQEALDSKIEEDSQQDLEQIIHEHEAGEAAHGEEAGSPAADAHSDQVPAEADMTEGSQEENVMEGSEQSAEEDANPDQPAAEEDEKEHNAPDKEEE
ncbi:sperm surface protein Sp17 [Ambystoma mexicanum]|uniref:sperm surface protein Sp17 n=1 Tax=Ambystoma mexicanum TaxID=8296 RepID=UPI0037E96033